MDLERVNIISSFPLEEPMLEDRLELLISKSQIEQKLQEVANLLNKAYEHKKLVLIMIMKGAFCVTANLMQKLSIPFTIEYIKASSYGKGGTKQSDLLIQGIKDLDIASRDVLVIDDIFDNGITMKSILNKLQEKKPSSVKSLVLLRKVKSQPTDYIPNYVLFEVPNRFVVGYGLDYKEYFRGLPGIYAFTEEPDSFLQTM